MDIIKLIPQTYNHLIDYILVLTRILSLFGIFVFFRRDYVNQKILISLAVILATYVTLINPHQTIEYEFFSFAMLKAVILQIFMGFLAGFILNCVFEIFMATGQIISTQIGFSMVTLFDPLMGSITSLTKFYDYFAMIIFLMLNGHLTLIKLLLDSFISFPIGYQFLTTESLKNIIDFSTIIFSYAISLSMTILITILLTNITVAIISKFSPQFNIFSVGISITMIIGLLLVYLTFNIFVNEGKEYILYGMNFLHQFIYSGK